MVKKTQVILLYFPLCVFADKLVLSADKLVLSADTTGTVC